MLGKSFLLAVAVMSFFALILSLGAVLKNPHIIKAVPFLGNRGIQFVAMVLNESGLVVIRFMPLVFAVAIASGTADKGDKELAAFSALIGYLFMLTFSALAINFFGLALAPDVSVGDNNLFSIGQTLEMRRAMQNVVLGMQTTDTGVLGGIIVGITASWVTRRFKNKKLPLIFSFYQGKHFPPIMTALIFIPVGLVIPFIWPVIGGGIYKGAEVIVQTGPFGSFMFGFVERLLIPTGLHHVWYSIVHFTPVGGTLEIAGEVFSGTKAITTAALSSPDFTDNISHITRLWLGQGATPIKVFGIPGACLAMYHVARDKNKAKAVAIAAAVASVFAGVTEPFEFLFLFLAAPLFLIHAALSGLSFAILDLLGTSYLGSNNIIELIVNGVMQGHKSTWIPIVIVGAFMFVTYYFLFRWYIVKFNVLLPGRQKVTAANEFDEIEPENQTKAKAPSDKIKIAKQVIKAVGGEGNIKEYTNCFTRLRIFVNDPSKINQPLLETVPDAIGFHNPNEGEIHIVFGMTVDEYRQAVDQVIENS